jgi:hypothetical protein
VIPTRSSAYAKSKNNPRAKTPSRRTPPRSDRMWRTGPTSSVSSAAVIQVGGGFRVIRRPIHRCPAGTVHESRQGGSGGLGSSSSPRWIR